MSEAEIWRRCSACKQPIAFGAVHWTCSVSTCNRKRTALAFCSVGCWEVHLPGARHREAWAVERRAPSRREAEARDREGAAAGEGAQRAPERAIPAARSAPAAPRPEPAAPPREPSPSGGTRRLVRPAAAEPAAEAPREVLIVASRLKEYVRATSGMNTSDRVLEPLSEIVRRVCDEAVRSARREGRRTVLDRDVPRG